MICDLEYMRMKAASHSIHGFVNFVLIGEFNFEKRLCVLYPYSMFLS